MSEVDSFRMDPSLMQQWYVLYTKPGKETLVNRQLEEKELEVYFPVFHFDRGYGRGIRIEPFFPHYLFVKVDLMAKNANNLRWIVGMRSIVEVCDQPVVVPELVIQNLRERINPITQRISRKSEWLYQPGQKVLITAGPFKGYEAIFQKGLSGEQRVQVLLKFLGSMTRTTVDLESLTTTS